MPDNLFDTDEVKGAPAPGSSPIRLAEVLTVGTDTGFASDLKIDPETGEVLEDLSAPKFGEIQALEIASYIGPRITGAQARLDAYKAEREAWEKKIGEIYGPKIRREESYLAYLKGIGNLWLKDFAKASLSSGKTRTLTLGLIKLSFRTIPRRVKVTDDPAAVAWAEEHYPGAVKTVKSVLISQIPPHLQDEAATTEGSGFTEFPEEEKFEVK